MKIKSVETYIVSSEDEASQLISNAKQSFDFDLAKYSSEYKEKKDYFVVTITKIFNSQDVK